VRSTAAAIGLACCLAIVWSSTAMARQGSQVGAQSDPDQWAWVTARKPTTTDYTPAAKDQGTVGSSAAVVHRSGVGQYQVMFPGIANPNRVGTVLVTALSGQPRYCLLYDFGEDVQADITVFVRCYSFDGQAADSKFSVVFTSGGLNSGTFAFLLDNGNTQTDFTPDPNYVYSSAFQPNTVHRSAVGTYQATLSGMPPGEGDLQLSTTPDANCRITGWSGTTSMTVAIKCFAEGTNALIDNGFSLVYSDDVGMTGLPGRTAAYLFANKPTTSSYTPAAAYRYSSGMQPYVKRSGKGTYTVVMPGMPVGGAASVSAVGAGKSRCQLTSIATSKPQKVGVACFTPSGSPVDSQFTFSYTK